MVGYDPASLAFHCGLPPLPPNTATPPPSGTRLLPIVAGPSPNRRHTRHPGPLYPSPSAICIVPPHPHPLHLVGTAPPGPLPLEWSWGRPRAWMPSPRSWGPASCRCDGLGPKLFSGRWGQAELVLTRLPPGEGGVWLARNPPRKLFKRAYRDQPKPKRNQN